MSRRQTLQTGKQCLPSIWLMTDPRFGERLAAAVRKLPTGSGVIFRHYELTQAERKQLFARIRRICRQRGHLILLAGDEATARRWHADGFHQRADRRQSPRMIHSAGVHNRNELAIARRNGVDLILLSPLFATASHPATVPLGIGRFMTLARQNREGKIIALGGLTVRKAAMLDKSQVHGWAAIDAFRN